MHQNSDCCLYQSVSQYLRVKVLLCVCHWSDQGELLCDSGHF